MVHMSKLLLALQDQKTAGVKAHTMMAHDAHPEWAKDPIPQCTKA